MFTNVNSIEEIKGLNEIGFLYIFDASNYDNDISVLLEDVVKLGMTRVNIKSRLSQYKTPPKNISYINCSEPSKRERILKNYIKEKLNIKPICGSEYFKGCRKELEQVILYFASCNLDIINKYYELYKDIEEKTRWFETINIEERMELYKNKIMDNSVFSCEFCDSSFTLKRNLVQHLKTSKKCISKRPKIDISCIWCKGDFITKDDLDKHYKKCNVNKEIEHIKLIEENKSLIKENKSLTKEIDNIKTDKEKEIERLNSIIKDLTSKIKGDTTINNPVTYNITLNCAKPLLLSKERIIKLMNSTCVPRYIRNGQEGLADWFLNDVCRNDNSDIAIECTDKKRKKFRYEDENDIPKEISAIGLTDLLRDCIPTFKNTTYYHQAKQEAQDMLDEHKYDGALKGITDFEKPGTKFINYLIDKTHVESSNCLITKKGY